jgi:hypothetical protein
VDGDASDLRFLDPRPRVVALKAKGKGARDDTTGFVVDPPPGRVNFVLAKPHVKPLKVVSDPVQVAGRCDSHAVPSNGANEEVRRADFMSHLSANHDPIVKGGPNGQAPDRSPPYAEPLRQTDDHPGAAGPAPEVGGDALPPLSEADQRHLLGYEKKMQLVRDRVVGVITGRTHGLYVWGPAGTGKSYTIIGILRELQANYRLHNSRMDGRGLFTALERDPDAIHVLEDCEQMMHNRNVRGLLRSATWGQRDGGGPMERVVTWPVGGGKRELRFHFEGGLLIAANLPPADIPEMEAVTTRIPVIHLAASDAEVRAKMRHLAWQGYEDARGHRLTPGECLEVAEHVIGQCQGLDRSLDLRLLVNSYEDYLQWSEGEAGLHWRDLVATRVRQRPAGIRSPVLVTATGGTRVAIAACQQADRDVAREIAQATEDPEERLRLWVERTGKSRATLYRRLAELND